MERAGREARTDYQRDMAVETGGVSDKRQQRLKSNASLLMLNGISGNAALRQQAIQMDRGAEELIQELQGEFVPDADLNPEAQKDETFGVELEVIYPGNEMRNASIIGANERQLTTLRLHYPNPKTAQEARRQNSGKWSWTQDVSVGDSITNVGLEWVSPVFKICPETWDSIKTLCDIIKENRGTIDTTCSEHIHVGKEMLDHSQEGGYPGLFKLYRIVQDVVNVFARSSYQFGEDGEEARFQIRSGHEQFAKDMPERPEELGESGARLEALKDVSRQVMAICSDFELEKLLLKNYRAKHEEEYGACFGRLKEIAQNQIRIPLSECGLIDVDSYHLLTPGSKRGDENAEGLFTDTIKIILVLKAICENGRMLDAYFTEYGIIPLKKENRYYALNIQQNFSTVKKHPTVEMRKFNGTLNPAVIQANVLLSTCLVQTAAAKNQIQIDEFVAFYNAADSPMRIVALLDFITDDDRVKKVLLKAYTMSLNPEELELFLAAFPFRSEG